MAINTQEKGLLSSDLASKGLGVTTLSQQVKKLNRLRIQQVFLDHTLARSNCWPLITDRRIQEAHLQKQGPTHSQLREEYGGIQSQGPHDTVKFNPEAQMHSHSKQLLAGVGRRHHSEKPLSILFLTKPVL